MTRYLAALLLIPSLALAHGGEDHGDGAKPAIAAGSAAPRAEAQTEAFELLATPAGGQLTLYLDRYASNAPVNGAQIEVESGQWKARAQAAGDGSYRVAAPQFAKPGQYPLQFTVQAGSESDLLETTLVVSAAAEPAAQAGAHRNPMWWWVGGALAGLAGLSWLLKRRNAAQRISA